MEDVLKQNRIEILKKQSALHFAHCEKCKIMAQYKYKNNRNIGDCKSCEVGEQHRAYGDQLIQNSKPRRKVAMVTSVDFKEVYMHFYNEGKTLTEIAYRLDRNKAEILRKVVKLGLPVNRELKFCNLVTPNQIMILRYKRCSDEDIAQQFGVSESTVKRYRLKHNIR